MRSRLQWAGHVERMADDCDDVDNTCEIRHQ